MSFAELIEKLESSTADWRRVDSEVACALLAPSGARLDDDAGLDGWDILVDEDDVWMEAADVPYATAFVDSAIELCTRAMPTEASAIILRAMAKLTDKASPGDANIAARIAREILVESVYRRGQTEIARSRAA